MNYFRIKQVKDVFGNDKWAFVFCDKIIGIGPNEIRYWDTKELLVRNLEKLGITKDKYCK